jgi:hypothetical protein
MCGRCRPLVATCALGQLPSAIGQDCMRRRAYTSAPPSPARSNLNAAQPRVSFGRLSGYEMSANHQPIGGRAIRSFTAQFCFRPCRMRHFERFWKGATVFVGGGIRAPTCGEPHFSSISAHGNRSIPISANRLKKLQPCLFTDFKKDPPFVGRKTSASTTRYSHEVHRHTNRRS